MRDPQYTELKELRERHGLKSTVLADFALIDRSRLSTIENRRTPFTASALRQLVSGYEKLGFKQAKFALYDIFKRENPLTERRKN